MKSLILLVMSVTLFFGIVVAQDIDLDNFDFSTLSSNPNITPEMIRRVQSQRANTQEVDYDFTEAENNRSLLDQQIGDAHYDSLYLNKVLRRFFDRDSLKKRIDRYGENFFLFPMQTFQPITSVPIPKDYRFGPGDRIEISIWGDVRNHFTSEVRADGTVMLPHIGRINAMGMTYENLRQTLVQRYSSVFSTLAGGGPNARSHLDLNLSKMRMIKVYVLGEALNPGAYDLYGMSDVYSAIYFSGGPSPEGSFRDIRLVRDGTVLDTIDLYEFIIDGKINRELRLEDGDIIVYGPQNNLVEIEGAILRPLKYELKDDETLGDLIKLSGGLRGNAHIDNITVTRYITFEDRATKINDKEVVNLNFSSKEEVETSDFILVDLDYVKIKKVGIDMENRVKITGSPVRHPGSFGLNSQLQTLSDLISHAGGLKDDFYNKASVFRKTEDKSYSVFTHNFETDENFPLLPDDSVHIFSKHEIRIKPSITISGLVNKPQDIPYYVGMKISDALLLAEGIEHNADLKVVEINRRDIEDINTFNIISVVEIDSNLNIIEGEDYKLEPHDVIIVRRNPKFERNWFVNITGSVLYPGRYYLKDSNERVVDIIERAGGVKEDGNINATTFHRDDERLSIDIARGYSDPSHRNNILLLKGDSIHVPRMDMTVRVYGEVFFPSKVVWETGRSASFYINQAGGIRESGDEKRVVAFKGNGQRAFSRTCWFDDRLDPGSTIYVPVKADTDRLKYLETLRIFRESIGIFSSVASLVVTYYTIKMLREDLNE